MVKRNRFYMMCTRESIGQKVSFHQEKGSYSSSVEGAKEFSLDEAQQYWSMARDIDIPISADHVDALTHYAIDHQYVSKAIRNNEPNDQGPYYAYRKGRYDGNDLYFVNNKGLTWKINEDTVVFDEPPEYMLEDHEFISVAMANKIKRKVFLLEDINKRKMIQAAGLVTPKQFLARNSRPKSMNNRHNCSGCGNFFWDYNPYAELCNNCD